MNQLPVDLALLLHIDRLLAEADEVRRLRDEIVRGADAWRRRERPGEFDERSSRDEQPLEAV